MLGKVPVSIHGLSGRKVPPLVMSLNGHPRASATLYAQSCSIRFASFRTSYALRAGDAVGNVHGVSQPLKDLCHVRIDGGGVARRSEACTTPSETFAGTKSAIASPSEPVDERGKGRSEPKLTSHEVAHRVGVVAAV
jgi:hypothetical protein